MPHAVNRKPGDLSTVRACEFFVEHDFIVLVFWHVGNVPHSLTEKARNQSTKPVDSLEQPQQFFAPISIELCHESNPSAQVRGEVFVSVAILS